MKARLYYHYFRILIFFLIIFYFVLSKWASLHEWKPIYLKFGTKLNESSSINCKNDNISWFLQMQCKELQGKHIFFISLSSKTDSCFNSNENLFISLRLQSISPVTQTLAARACHRKQRSVLMSCFKRCKSFRVWSVFAVSISVNSNSRSFENSCSFESFYFVSLFPRCANVFLSLKSISSEWICV